MLERLLGSGGTGSVFLATDLQLERKVAIKILHHWTAGSSTQLKRFELEAHALSQLHHVNVIQVFRFGETESTTPFLVMEYVEGESLRSLLDRKSRLRCDETVAIALQICAALHFAHSCGIVHRDLKPENIMLSSGDNLPIVKILDFGLSKLCNGNEGRGATLTETGLILGTARYISPEQGLGEQVDLRTDIYSFGCVLFEMITGEAPFNAEAPAAILLKHLSEPVPRILSLSPNCKLPRKLESIICKACAKNRDERYQSFAEIIEDLSDHEVLSNREIYVPVKFHASYHKQLIQITRAITMAGCFALFCLAIFLAFTDEGHIAVAVQLAQFHSASQSVRDFSEMQHAMLKAKHFSAAKELVKTTLSTRAFFNSRPSSNRVQLLYNYVQNYKNAGKNDEAFELTLTFFSTVFESLRREQLDPKEPPPSDELKPLALMSRQVYYEKHSRKEWQAISKICEINGAAFPRNSPDYLLWPAALRAKSRRESNIPRTEDEIVFLSKLYVQSAEIAQASNEADLMFEMANAGLRLAKKHELFYDEHCYYALLCRYYLRANQKDKALLALSALERVSSGLLLSNAETGQLNRLRADCGVGKLTPLPPEDSDHVSLLDFLLHQDEKKKAPN